ncbi:MAG: efflux RND transporter periplasmic adaptor subunit [Pseudomonadota bacterium]
MKHYFATVILCLSALGAGAQEVRAPAVVVPQAEAVMSAQGDFQLMAFDYGAGEAFVEGAPLVRFDCALPQASLAAAEFELSAARADTTSKTALLSRGGIGRTEVAIARARLGAAEAEVQGALALVKRCTIRAPFAGVVVEHLVNPFETVEAAQDVIQIISNAQVEVDMIAPSAWLRWLKPGDLGMLALEETGARYQVRITELSPVVDAVSRSIKVKAAFLERPQNVRPGMSGAIEMEAPGG